MINTETAALCCGCGVCVQACPKGCIRMVTQEDGFLRARADRADCIGCGACERVCPMQTASEPADLPETVCAAYARQAQLRFCGSSGGMFGLLARQVLKEGGVVFGAAFDADLKLRCTCAQSVGELEPLYKSKYLQSDMSAAYPALQRLLSEGRTVLFTGTPCQNAALRRLLPQARGQLLLVDFFCHGVASQAFFDRCREDAEQSRHIRITDYQFRAKKKRGACPHYYRLQYEKRGKRRSETRLYLKSPFYLAYESGLSLRESCYACPFADGGRVSDLTLGDFHTIERHLRGINRFDGISAVLVNTEAGRRLWETVSAQTVCHPLPLAPLRERGELLAGATPRPKRQAEFSQALQTQPTRWVIRRYCNPRRQWQKSVYYHLPKPARAMLKRLLRME